MQLASLRPCQFSSISDIEFQLRGSKSGRNQILTEFLKSATLKHSISILGSIFQKSTQSACWQGGNLYFEAQIEVESEIGLKLWNQRPKDPCSDTLFSFLSSQFGPLERETIDET